MEEGASAPQNVGSSRRRATLTEVKGGPSAGLRAFPVHEGLVMGGGRQGPLGEEGRGGPTLRGHAQAPDSRPACSEVSVAAAAPDCGPTSSFSSKVCFCVSKGSETPSVW